MLLKWAACTGLDNGTSFIKTVKEKIGLLPLATIYNAAFIFLEQGVSTLNDFYLLKGSLDNEFFTK